jgi:hypothetical protein
MFSQKKRQKVDVSFSSTSFFDLSRFRVFLAMGVPLTKTQQQKLQKKTCRKVLTQKIDKHRRPICFLRLFYHPGRFTARGVQKRH